MFAFLKSIATLEKELRCWFLEDQLRTQLKYNQIMGKAEGVAERAEIVADVYSIRDQHLVEQIATDLLPRLRDEPMEAKIFGIKPPRADIDHRAKGLRLLRAFVKAKDWRLECDANGCYKVK